MNVTLADGRVLTLPRLKFGVMGRPGSGKSHLIASMPKPMLLISTDPYEKLQPYWERCGEIVESVGQFGQPVYVGKSPTSGKPIMQVEIFYELEPSNPQAMNGLLGRAEQLVAEVKAVGWASFGLDSWSQLEYIAHSRRATGPLSTARTTGNQDGRAVYNSAKDDIRPFLWSRIMPLACNVGIAFHTTEKPAEEGGVSVYGIKAIGDLSTSIASILPERYRAEAMPDGETRRLHTRPDGRFDLCTLINAPSPCKNDYAALFANWIAKRAAQPATAAAAPSEKEKTS